MKTQYQEGYNQGIEDVIAYICGDAYTNELIDVEFLEELIRYHFNIKESAPTKVIR